MRRARFTYPGAVHHVVLRSRSRPGVFSTDDAKADFLEILAARARQLRIRLIAFCLLDDEGHLVVENGSGRMSEWLKQVNATFGMRYRRAHGGSGSLFRGRFHSSLVQDEASLRQVILYVLQSPARSRPGTDPGRHRWSNLGECLQPGPQPLTDVAFVAGLWGEAEALGRAVAGPLITRLPSYQTTFGRIVGEKNSGNRGFSRRRPEEQTGPAGFEPPADLYREFEARYRLDFGEAQFDTHARKRQRGELLLALRERSGLSYREICGLPGFAELRESSLGKLCQDARRRRARGEG